MTEQFTSKEHEVYIGIVKSLLDKVQKKHPNENPNRVIETKIRQIGEMLAELGDFANNEAFILLAFIATVPSARLLAKEGPDEVSKYVKGMAELFAYTLLDRIPDVINQMSQAQRAQNNKVVLPS